MTFDVIVAGHLCLDLLPEMHTVPLDKLASPGKLFEVGPITLATGGAVSNTGLALHRLGVNVGLMTSIGADFIGQAIRGVIAARDPRLTELIGTRDSGYSSYTVVLSPGGQDRIFLHATGTNADFSSADIDFDLVAQAKLFHLGYPPILPRLYEDDGDELVTIYRRVHQSGVVTSLDMSLPDATGGAGTADWWTILRRTLPFVDIFVPSIEEIIFMLRRDDYAAWGGRVMPHLTRAYLRGLAEDLLALGCAITGFKLGPLGMYLHATPDRDRLARLVRLPLPVEAWARFEAWHPAFSVAVVGTTGAGDSCYGGLLAALLRGDLPHDALRLACAVGACNVEAADALSGVRSLTETLARLEAGWPTRHDTLPEGP
ncbi:MAG: carbohydrate kinase family protein [Anaerolineae bacterium]|nr:carbohydrate kinase family protein [Anaerolineae bacterium]